MQKNRRAISPEFGGRIDFTPEGTSNQIVINMLRQQKDISKYTKTLQLYVLCTLHEKST